MTSARSERPFHQVVAVAAAAGTIDTRTAAILLPLLVDALIFSHDGKEINQDVVAELSERDAFYAATCYGYSRCCKMLGIADRVVDLAQVRADARQALNASLTAAAVAYRQA